MKTHQILAQIDDADYVALARGKVLVRRLFNLEFMPSNSQVISWMLRSVPWEELENGVLLESGKDEGNGKKGRNEAEGS